MPNPSNPPASAPKQDRQVTLRGRRDCMGMPLSVGDMVEYIDDEKMQILAFDGDDRFVYAQNGSLRTVPCICAVRAK